MHIALLSPSWPMHHHPNGIVTYVRRPKRPPRKKAQAAAIASPAIVTAKNPHRRSGLDDVSDMTPEEHQRRGDAADALFRELARRATGKHQS